MTYKEQLLHPRWQRRRLEILQRADWKCEKCREEDKTLHVHHKIYRKGAMAWEYEDDELIALCKDCHESEHQDEKELQPLRSEIYQILQSLEMTELHDVLGYVTLFKAYQLDDNALIQIRSHDYACGLASGLGIGWILDDGPPDCNNNAPDMGFYLLGKSPWIVGDLLQLRSKMQNSRRVRGMANK